MISLFYAGRRKYLKDSNEKETNDDALLPPDIFKTPRQIRNINKNKSQTAIDNKSFHFSFQQRKPDEDNIDNYLRKLKKQIHSVQGQKFVIEHYSSIIKEDWIVTKEAGVVLYINKNTGEVSSICPWIEQEHIQKSNHHPPTNNTNITNTKQLSSSSLKINRIDEDSDEDIEEEDIDELGTGSLVYDRSEVEALFELLDSSNNKTKK